MHQHDEARILLPTCGAFGSDYGRRTFRIEFGEALYRPRGEGHADLYEGLTDCVALLLPDGGELRRLHEPMVAQNAALARAALALRAEADATDAASNLIAEGLAILVSTIVLNRAPLAERGSSHWIGSVRDRLEGAYETPPSLAELARGVDRDPAYVTATFKRVYGVSAGAYVRRLKLWQARDRIDADSSSPLSDVAQDCGFADQSHFTRHFRRLFGVTPGAYRARRAAQRRRGPEASRCADR